MDSDSTTWTRVVDTTATGSNRACVFCGAGALHNFKTVSARDVWAVCGRESMVKDACFRILSNLLESCEQFHEAYGKGEEAMVVTCMCCHHWVFRSAHRRTKARFLPLQALRMYLVTLGEGRKPSSRHVCDARILHRLSRSVVDVLLVKEHAAGLQNVYKTAFTEDEVRTLRAVAGAPVQQAHAVFALRWHLCSGGTLFVPTAGVAEAVREATQMEGVRARCEKIAAEGATEGATEGAEVAGGRVCV